MNVRMCVCVCVCVITFICSIARVRVFNILDRS